MKNQTDITFILDRSGSMESVREDIIGGFNNFLQVQKDTEADIVCSLIQFDDHYEPVFEGVEAKKCAHLTTLTYTPRGTTALYDALGKTIKSTGERLARKPEDMRPNKVVIVVLTDGFENASFMYGSKEVAHLIKHQTEEYKWEFVFIGSNQDAILSAGKVGINAAAAMTIAPTADAYAHAFNSTAQNARLYASGQAQDMSFSCVQKAEAQSKIDLFNQTKGN